ncbi:hypothetical protein [Romboutsia sp.]|uniref:hypothetical protein n=1 Tax=Romboutsia sp. TaxID=1965302 RepID=UPI003F3E1CBC
MTRLKRVQKIVKVAEEKKEVSKTRLKRLRKLSIGTHEVEITSAELSENKDYLINLGLQSMEDERKGRFSIPIDGFSMDSLLEIIYGECDQEEVCLEELVGHKVIAVIVRNGKFLNVDYFESLDNAEEEDEIDLYQELEDNNEEYLEDEIELDDFI